MLTANKSLVTQYDHIYSGDPAIDQDAPDIADKIRLYRETGDESHLPLSDSEPTRFVLQQIRGTGLARISEALGQYQRRNADNEIPLATLIDCCRLALVDAKNFDAGKIKRERDPELRRKVVSEDTLDLLCDTDPGLITDIGLRAFMEAFLSPLSSKESDSPHG